ncbi:MAG TPA: 3-oxoacyl-[acyl-carrier-protein] synthase III C-terminal domain-containing protein [Bacillota bacterium]|nr:3-oxoacyl-[acyl-carrier-protein] synthase III C-terminal domain-containing protein [Bacillota bacterium]
MAYISSVGLGIPNHHIHQDEVKALIKQIFTYSERKLDRLLSVFDRAAITNRQLVVGLDWFLKDHSFQEKNDLYVQFAREYSLSAIDHCLTNGDFIKKDIPFEAIDMIIFVSSTGIATPSIDTLLMNDRPFRANVMRMPLWGLGCAGGAIGLSRARDWLVAHPDNNVLVICSELCSLTFQKGDMRKSNLIGTALFGDGTSAVLLMGERSPYQNYQKQNGPKIIQTSSVTEKNSSQVMGWNVTNQGFEVIFSKNIPNLVHTVWKNHLDDFLTSHQLTEQDIHSFIAHPGGRKVLEAMEGACSISRPKLLHSYNILKHHGNMSSATVLYVLEKWLKETKVRNKKSVLSALGPGFSSELLLLEWDQ